MDCICINVFCFIDLLVSLFALLHGHANLKTRFVKNYKNSPLLFIFSPLPLLLFCIEILGLCAPPPSLLSFLCHIPAVVAMRHGHNVVHKHKIQIYYLLFIIFII